MAGPSGAGCAHNHQKAFRDSEVRKRRRLVRPPGAHGEPAQHEWLADPCAKLCGECGYLVLPVVPRGDPMRRIERSRVMPGECPHCHEQLWVDFAHVPSAMLVRQDELDVSRSRSDTGSARVIVGAGTVLASTVSLLPWDGWMLLPFVWGCGIAMATWLERRAPRGGRRPRRWHRPVARWKAGSALVRGRVSTHDQLVAPLSGRAAVGWLVHVRYAQRKVIPEVRGTDHPSWALVEQCVAPLAVDGRSIVETCTLDLAPVRIDTLHPDAQRWLKTRGLDPQDQFDMFETVIRHDDTVELATDRRGGPPVLRLA